MSLEAVSERQKEKNRCRTALCQKRSFLGRNAWAPQRGLALHRWGVHFIDMIPRTIVTLAFMQLLTIFVGVMLTAIFLRFLTTDWPNEPAWMPAFPRFMRNYGFWLLMLPVAWASASVFSVRSLDSLPEIHRNYLIAGYVIWIVLALIFLVSVGQAYESAFGFRPQELRTPPDAKSIQTSAVLFTLDAW